MSLHILMSRTGLISIDFFLDSQFQTGLDAVLRILLLFNEKKRFRQTML